MNKQEFDLVRGLAALLEKYIPEIQSKKADEGYTFLDDDKALWMSYYEKLILTDVLMDGKAFGAKSNNTHLGIGKDATFVSAELYQLLMQCYKYLYNALSSGEIYLKYNGWYLAEKDGKTDHASD